MELQTSKVRMPLDVEQKPPFLQGLLLSAQHVFAMFGATILVPLILGMPVSVALFASGIGTLIYMVSTQFKVPVYLGSSFAFIQAMAFANSQMNGDVSAAQTGVVLVGLVYVGMALLITAFINTKAKGFLKIIPFLFGIIGGYLVAVVFGLVDFKPVLEAAWFEVPHLYLPFETGGFFSRYHLYFGPETWAILPVAVVTIAEHIGDHTVLGQICGRKFLEKPGLHRTLIGDGVATAVSAFIGGPANTTYGENTGVVGMTRIASVSVIRNAALFAIGLSFMGKFTAIISTIPKPVLGGMAILLYGVIASNGLKVLIEKQVDFHQVRNLIIASSMLVLGLGGAVLKLGPVTLSGTALCALAGVLLNLILPHEEKFQDQKVEELLGEA